MAAKKDKSGIEALRKDIQVLQESFTRFRDAMLTDAAVTQAEQQQSQVAVESLDLPALSPTDLIEAASLLSAVGNPQRLQMVIILAQDSASVTTLMEQLALATTGAAYHHLKVLMNQGLVEQPQRGTFTLTDEALPRVQQLLTALFGDATVDESGKKSKKKKRGN